MASRDFTFVRRLKTLLEKQRRRNPEALAQPPGLFFADGPIANMSDTQNGRP
jgi:hypothetical protein